MDKYIEKTVISYIILEITTATSALCNCAAGRSPAAPRVVGTT